MAKTQALKAKEEKALEKLVLKETLKIERKEASEARSQTKKKESTDQLNEAKQACIDAMMTHFFGVTFVEGGDNAGLEIFFEEGVRMGSATFNKKRRPGHLNVILALLRRDLKKGYNFDTHSFFDIVTS